MELPIRGEAEQAFIDALYEQESKNPDLKAERLRERIKELSMPDANGRVGIKAVLDLPKCVNGKTVYELRANEQVKSELDSIINCVKSERAVPIYENRQAIDRSHPFRIETGNLNELKDPGSLGKEYRQFTLKKALISNTNFNLAVEPALLRAWQEINEIRSEAVEPENKVRGAMVAASKGLAATQEAQRTEAEVPFR